MFQKIANNSMLIALLALVCSAAIVMQVLYARFTVQRLEDYRVEGQILAQLVTGGYDGWGEDWFSARRVLLIDAQGQTHTLTSQLDAVDGVDAQFWTEVQQARETGEGHNVQHSKELSAQTIAYALLLEDGSVLHVSGEQDTRLSIAMQCLWGLLALLLAVILLSLWWAGRVTRGLIAPLQKASLTQLDEQQVCPELRPLTAQVLAENQEMQRGIQKQHAELKREYEKQDRARRDFTANVSHELKTPLTSISGYAEIIRDGMVRPDDVAPFAGKIYDETQRMITLVGDILKLSQLDEGHQVRLERVSLDLYGLCRQVVDSLEGKAAQREIGRAHV